MRRKIVVEYEVPVIERRTIEADLPDDIDDGDADDWRHEVSEALADMPDEPPLPDDFLIVEVDGKPVDL